MSINNFSSRTMTENCAIEYDYPWMKFNGPVELDGAVTGDGTVDPGNGQTYGTELIYYPLGAPGGTVISSALIERANTSFTNIANTRSYFRYFDVNDEFTFRFRNTENNTCNLRVNITYFAL